MNSLSDFKEFLKHSESVRSTSTSKKTEFTSTGRNGSNKATLTPSAKEPTKPRPQNPLPFPFAAEPEDKLSEDSLMDFIKKLAEKEGISEERLLANLMKKNSASNSYQSFLLTDMMVKGSFLMFNFWLLLKDAQNGVMDSAVSTSEDQE